MKNKRHKIKFIKNSITRFTTRLTMESIKRFLARFISLAGIALFTAGFISVFAIADVYAAGTCVDLAGQSTLVGAGDAGEFDFADPPTADYGAKLCQPDVPENPFELHGWVWNNNLGWVSLACEDEGNGGLANEGLACGNYTYGVKIDETTGKMSGWAWGDNIGWISFGCDGGLNENKTCGGIDYNGTSKLIVDKDLGTMGSYAWADSVGWFNLDGIRAEMLKLVMAESTSETEFGVWTKGENSESPGNLSAIPNKKTAQVADGKSRYNLFVHIADTAGNPVVNSTDVIVEITPHWTDSVRLDQVNPNGGITPDFSLNNQGAALKPLDVSDFNYGTNTTQGSVTNNYKAKIYSFAPTDNFYDAPSANGKYNGVYDGIEEGEIYYREFGNTDTDTIPANELIYHGTDVKITLVPTGEVWETTAIPPINSGGDYPMIFLPFFEFKDFHAITDVTQDPTNPDNQQNYIESFRNMIDYYLIEPTANVLAIDPSKFIKMQIQFNLSAPNDVEYLWIDDDEVDLIGLTGDTVKKIQVKSNVMADIKNELPKLIQDLFKNDDFITMGLPYAPSGKLQGQIDGAKAYITVSYYVNGKKVSYFDNGIPRIADSGIVNQAAEITGNVYSSGAITVSADTEAVTSLGNVSSNALQNQVLENVSRLIAGANVEGYSTTPTKFSKKAADVILGGGRAYYFKNRDVHITDVSWLPENPTIIVEGGDVFIDANIDNDDGPIGIIVLADYSDTNELTKGGRVYIRNDVTDFVGHIYADGPMFRYVKDLCQSTSTYASGATGVDGFALYALREPNFVQPGRACDNSAGTDYANPVTTLDNQLYMKGSFATYNCIGCSIEDPYRGDGQLLNGRTPLNYAIAKLYDLNYFSYFRILPDGGGDSGARSSILPAGNDGPVYIDYSPIPGNMLGFI
jgi:hypothetical protein